MLISAYLHHNLQATAAAQDIAQPMVEETEAPGSKEMLFALPQSHHFASLPDPSLCLCSVQEYLWEASHYLVKQVFSGIKEMFTVTRDIQVRRLLPLTAFSSPLVHPYIDQWMLHGERWFFWVLAQRGSSCPSSEVQDCASP